jgi:hypothetical protein
LQLDISGVNDFLKNIKDADMNKSAAAGPNDILPPIETIITEGEKIRIDD